MVDFALDRIMAVPTHEEPKPIPWPSGLEPTPVPDSAAPDDPLPTAEVLVVTWTYAEGMALADVMTPGVPSSSWKQYAHNWAQYESQLTGRSPARDAGCMGYQAQTQIGSTKVTLVKSELHLTTDAVSAPIVQLWEQMVAEVRPKLVITTGTAGGIGAATQLGDVFAVPNAKFNCTKAFASKPWAQQRFTGNGISTGPQAGLFSSLVTPNAGQLEPIANRGPLLTFGGDVETVDYFAFANTEDTFGVVRNDPLAHTEEMDDATLPLALSQVADPPLWGSIRNASDPQVPSSVGDIEAQKQWAQDIYNKYGYWTTIGSAIACWVVIAGL
ncbi:MAG: hypothetical protein ABSB09_04435 [Acidimicrobiales bacterium]|jgi:nucleoside phosphorylase